MKKLLMVMMMIAAMVSLKASADQYVMVSVFAPGQIPIAQDHLNGARLSLIYGDCLSINGVDIGLAGRTRARFNGFQLGAGNIVGTDAAGCELGIVNYVEAGFYGFQFGLWNDVCGTFNGVQLGLVNFANKLNGLQVGLLNFIDEPNPTCRCLPIVNFGW